MGPGSYAVFTEILVFNNIFGFPMVNWPSIWTETVNFNCTTFEPKLKILNDFSNTVFLIVDYLWSKFQQDQTIFGGARAQKIPKRGHFKNVESIQKKMNI